MGSSWGVASTPLVGHNLFPACCIALQYLSLIMEEGGRNKDLLLLLLLLKGAVAMVPFASLGAFTSNHPSIYLSISTSISIKE